jgi:hypothetical protein
MKLVLVVFLIKLAAEMAGKKTNRKNKEAANKEISKTQHPAAFALR